jgi:hypothetical protein
VVAHREAVVVVGRRLEVVDVDVHGVTVAWLGDRDPRAHDGGEAVVARHLPPHVDLLVGHAAEAVVGQGLRGQARPQHDGAGQRVAGRHAEGERVAGQVGRWARRRGPVARRGGRPAAGLVAGAAGQDDDGRGPRPHEELATGDVDARRVVVPHAAEHGRFTCRTGRVHLDAPGVA